MTVLPKSVVLEVLETVEPDEEVIAACKSLKEMGYQIALDDFCIRTGMENMVGLADFVKVDFRISDKAQRERIREFVRGSEAKLIAEKVETEEEFQAAMEEGFDLFQGYFFCKPTVFCEEGGAGGGK